MWDLQNPKPVKLIIGILAADENALASAVKTISAKFGTIDLASDVWPFTQTEYYKDETGPNILRPNNSFDRRVKSPFDSFPLERVGARPGSWALMPVF